MLRWLGLMMSRMSQRKFHQANLRNSQQSLPRSLWSLGNRLRNNLRKRHSHRRHSRLVRNRRLRSNRRRSSQHRSSLR
jgi:hypothetical protein